MKPGNKKPDEKSTMEADVSGEKEFSSDYKDNAQFQHGRNIKYTEQLIKYLNVQYPTPTERLQKICIADFGCGDGTSTIHVYDELVKAGYANVHITGLDISQQQIEVARSQVEGTSKKVTFTIQDLTKYEVQSQFDAVYSFFAFHWMSDKQNLARKICNSLKEDGMLYYVCPSYLPEILAIRQQLLKELLEIPEWQSIFEDIKILPFAKLDEYIQSFPKFFNIKLLREEHEGLSSSTEKVKSLFTNWMPEIRHIRAKLKDQPGKIDAMIEDYLTKLIDKLPKDNSSKEPTNLVYHNYTIFCYAQKKPENDQKHLSPNLQN